MANMSYCRWQNTYSDLVDCANDLSDRADAPYEFGDLSDEEKSARRRMFSTMLDMLEQLGLEAPSRNDLEQALDDLEQREEDELEDMQEM